MTSLDRRKTLILMVQPKNDIGRLVRQARLNRGLSAYRLAVKLGIRRERISLTETGRQLPRPNLVVAIADVLELDRASLLFVWRAEKLKQLNERISPFLEATKKNL